MTDVIIKEMTKKKYINIYMNVFQRKIFYFLHVFESNMATQNIKVETKVRSL